MTPPDSETKHTADNALPGWARALTRILDDVVRVPGTRFGVGIDGLLGLLVPGLGDTVTGIGSAALLILALRLRLPTVVIGRMLVNIAVDVLLGSIPLLGDVFDIAFKANRLNLELIEKHRSDPRAAPALIDYVLVGGGLVLAVAAIVIPVMLWLIYGALLFSAISSFLGR